MLLLCANVCFLPFTASVNERGGAGAGPDGDMAGSGSPHYSLRWNNHQSHILHAFDTLLQSEALVDVTLVCEDTRRVRAHKVVLSACRWVLQITFRGGVWDPVRWTH